VLQIHCTESDLLRVRFSREPSPMSELVNALMMLQRRDNSLYDPWRNEVWSTFPSTARPLLELVLPHSAPDYLDSFSPNVEEGLQEVMCALRLPKISSVLVRCCTR
jgi:hypothetical protein